MKISEVLTEAGAAPRYYFAYGMLTDPNNMHGAELVGPALLRNFEFELFRFANVNPVPGAHVIGSLWQLDSNLLGQLDQIEGYPTLYDRKTVPVFTPDGHRYEAELYTMTPYTRERMLGTATTQSYVNSLTRGYKNAGIPMDQLSDAFRRDQPRGIKKKRSQAKESQLDEVADQPYRFISPVSTAVAQKSQFQTDSGVKMQVNIIVDQSSGTADVGFYDATDKDNPTIGMTGKGDAFRVFATVGAIVKQFVDRRRPPFLSFAGKTTDPGRIKLYDMIAKNIGRYLPEYKLVDSGFANGDKGYTFQRAGQLEEDASAVPAQQVLDYVKQIHPEGEFNIDHVITDHPQWTLSTVPVSSLHLFDPEQDDIYDPYNRVQDTNLHHVDRLIPNIASIVQKRPVVIDDQGYVLDGNHRALAALKAGLKNIPVWVPVKATTNENFADGKKPGRKGLAKRMGVPTKASVGKLRSIAKHSTGERARMAHWMANMKAGRAKKTNEEYDPNEKIIRHFMRWVYRRLNIKDDMPRLELDWTKDPGQHNTGSYNYKTNTLYVYMAHRNLIDILRTIAHELQHRKQGAQGRLHGHSPPGSKIEREADGEAGYLVKLYGAQHPNIMQ